jgi:hypothetical protein
MPEFENDLLKCKFKVPDHPTVRQQLAWYSELGFTQPSREQYWNAAKAILYDWECEALPDPQVNLDSIENPNQTLIIMWTGSQVLVYMDALNNLPKN